VEILRHGVRTDEHPTTEPSVPLVIREPSYEGEGVVQEIEVGRVLVRCTTAYQEVLIADTPAYGRTLFLDSMVQSASSDEAIYHELLIHPALVMHGRPRRVLVGGTGEGASIREILRHPTIERVVTVDLDGEVVELCRQHLPEWSDGALEDPRVDSRTGDFLVELKKADAASFDIIVSDLSDPVEAGPSSHLWGVEYFAELARVLAENGVLVVQAGEFDPHDLLVARDVRSTMLEVFPHVHFLHVAVPSFNCIWCFVVASMEPLTLCPEDLDVRIERLPRDDLRVYTPVAHRAAVEVPPYLQQLLIQPGRIHRG